MEQRLDNELLEQLEWGQSLEMWEQMQMTFDVNTFRKFLSCIYSSPNIETLFAETIERIIEFGWRHFDNKPDQFCMCLQQLLPDLLSFGEIAAFMDDNNLTETGRKEKAIQIEELAEAGYDLELCPQLSYFH